MKTMGLPSESLDIDPIEYLKGDVKAKVNAWKLNHVDEKEQFPKEELAIDPLRNVNLVTTT